MTNIWGDRYTDMLAWSLHVIYMYSFIMQYPIKCTIILCIRFFLKFFFFFLGDNHLCFHFELGLFFFGKWCLHTMVLISMEKTLFLITSFLFKSSEAIISFQSSSAFFYPKMMGQWRQTWLFAKDFLPGGFQLGLWALSQKKSPDRGMEFDEGQSHVHLKVWVEKKA
jgi:hypothetical protein